MKSASGRGGPRDANFFTGGDQQSHLLGNHPLSHWPGNHSFTAQTRKTLTAHIARFAAYHQDVLQETTVSRTFVVDKNFF